MSQSADDKNDIRTFIQQVDETAKDKFGGDILPALRENLGQFRPHRVLGMLVRTIDHFRDQEGIRSDPRSKWLAASGLCLVEHSRSGEVAPDEMSLAANALFKCGRHLVERSLLRHEALACLQRAVELYELLTQGGHVQFRPDLANARMILGIACNQGADLPGAMAQYHKALAAYQCMIDEGSEQFRPEIADIYRNLGICHKQSGDLLSAAAHYRDALEIYEALINDGAARFLPNAAHTRMNWGNVCKRGGDLLGAAAQFRAALAIYETLISEGAHHFRASAAHTLMNWGNVSQEAGDLPGAAAQFQGALTIYDTLIDERQLQYRPDAALTRTNCGNTLELEGNLRGAETQFSKALAMYEALISEGATQFQPDAARTRMNWGNTLKASGDLRGAAAQYRKALTTYQTLIADGATQFRPNAALTRMNWGDTLREQGDLLGAQEQFSEALSVYELLIADGAEQHTADAAYARMVWGTVLLQSGDFPGAATQLREAVDSYDRLIANGTPQYRADVARARMNLGNALQESGDLTGAAANCREAVETFDELIADGASQYRADAAIARTDMGKGLQNGGDLTGAAAKFREALAIYDQLIEEGSVQFLADRLDVEIDLGVVIPLPASSADPSHFQMLEAHLQNIQRTTSDPALEFPDVSQWKAAKACWRLCKFCDEPSRANDLADSHLAGMAWTVWLHCALGLLGSGRPGFLKPRIAAIRDHVDEVLSWRLKASDPAVLDWVLHTQGLRAQADLMTSHLDPKVRELAMLRKQIADIERVQLGESIDESLFSPERIRPLGGPANRKSDTATPFDPRAAVEQVQALRKLEVTLRIRLEKDGTLPKVPDFTSDQIAEHLAEDEQIWLLYPLQHGGASPVLVLVRLSRDSGGQGAPTLREKVQTFDLAGGDTWTSQLDRLGRNVGRDARSPMRWAPDPDLRDSSVPDTEEWEPALDEKQVETLREALWRSARPAELVALLGDACAKPDLGRIHIVPLGDAHALPWVNSLMEVADQWQAPDRPVTLRQYPSIGAWLVAQGFARQPAPASIQPMMVFDDARVLDDLAPGRDDPKYRRMYLPAVSLEFQYSRARWDLMRGSAATVIFPDGRQWPPQAGITSEPIHALFGFGHGGAPAGNWALSGLLMPSGCKKYGEARQRLLSAQHLPGLQHAERLYLSCCVLGRTDDQLGEPLGLLALAFGFRTRVAIGSLLPVNDLAAALISLAFQWELGRQGPGSDWVTVFQKLQRALRNGQWPADFADWLLPRVLADLRQAPDWLNGLMVLVGLPDWIDRAGKSVFKCDFRRSLRAVPMPIRTAADWFIALG